VALINSLTTKPKLNVSNIKSPFGGGASIPKISAGAGSFIRRPSAGIKPVRMFDVGRLSQIKTNVSVADDLSRQEGNVNAIAGQLAEINAVMQDIGGALALDFANRITEQKQDNKDLKDQVRSTRRALAERSVEGVKKIGKGIGSGITGVASKSAGGLSRIFDIVKLLGLGIAANLIIPSLGNISNWMDEHFNKILIAGGGILALNVMGGVGTLLKFGKLFLNPNVLAGLAILVSSIDAEQRKKKIRQDFNKTNDDSITTVDEFREENKNIKEPGKKKSKMSFLQGILELGSTPGAMNFHDGGIVGGPTQEVPAILERGEAVLTKEQLALISQKPGINLIEMDLPPITIPSNLNKAAKKIQLPNTTDVPYVTSVNSANKHMFKTPEIHGIIG